MITKPKEETSRSPWNCKVCSEICIHYHRVQVLSDMFLTTHDYHALVCEYSNITDRT